MNDQGVFGRYMLSSSKNQKHSIISNHLIGYIPGIGDYLMDTYDHDSEDGECNGGDGQPSDTKAATTSLMELIFSWETFDNKGVFKDFIEESFGKDHVLF
ncbi:hypothetical protein RND71_031975 [Anisodus tanguticus]|uniref:Uncharacterized protein n=1 Tax=Anisodus tanguticus TaxID=243964 RepID=A0AAE1RBQ7_9SOLA|nr:hypothetical protein RND71_031975 [Anisodus tanguticus]